MHTLNTQTRTHLYTHVHTYTHAYAHTCTYTHSHIYAPMHTPFLTSGEPSDLQTLQLPTRHLRHLLPPQKESADLRNGPLHGPVSLRVCPARTRGLCSSGCPGSQLVCSAAPQPPGSRAHHCPDGPLGSGLVPTAPTWTLPLSLQTPASPHPRVPAPGRALWPAALAAAGRPNTTARSQAESLHLQSSHPQASRWTQC